MAEYLPPDTMTIEAAADALTAELAEGDGTVHDVDRTFFDTFDGLLNAAELLLVYEDGRLVLSERDSGLERAVAETPPLTAPVLANGLVPGPLRDALAPVTGIRALLPLVHIHSRSRVLRVVDEERKTVARVTLEEPALVDPGVQKLRPRVRIEGVRGYGAELESARRHLEDELGFRAADQALVDEAVRTAGGVPGGISAKIAVPLGYNQRADDAAAQVLRRLLEVIEANLDGAVADIDTEFLHDLRVSVRRSRAVQRELKSAFPPAELQHFRTEFSWLQQITGEARDLDVYVLEFDAYRAMVPEEMRADLHPLLNLLRERRAAAHEEMVSALRSERARVARSQWRAFLDGLVALPVAERFDAGRPIGAVAGERIARVYRQMVKMGRAIDRLSPAEDYHELRKKGKELRYLLELFGAPIYPEEVVRPMVRTLKALQDVLGRHQDREVQLTTIRSLRDEVAAMPDGPAALMAMGVLVDRLSRDARAARAEFASRFAPFSTTPQRVRVRETFG